MIIDFHNHFYPPEFIDAVRTGPSNFTVTDDADGNPVLHSPGDYNVAVPGHRDIEYRTRVLDDLATRLDEVGKAAALRETSVVFAAVIGIVFFREKLGPLRAVLIGFVALGAVLVEGF